MPLMIAPESASAGKAIPAEQIAPVIIAIKSGGQWFSFTEILIFSSFKYSSFLSSDFYHQKS
jgi:hypothetical protein